MKHTGLIINADDLGVSKEINEAVFSLMASGMITSASILANGPAVDDAVNTVPDFPHCSFGVHLCISEYRPVSQEAELLTDEEGFLTASIYNGLTYSKKVLHAVFREWCSQVEGLLRRGVAVSHFDSHHHVHTNPRLFGTLKKVQKRFGISRLRLSKNMFGTDEPQSPGLILKKRIYNWMLRQIGKTETTDYFSSLSAFYSAARKGSIKTGKRYELMIHPGSDIPEYKGEIDLLKSTEFQECISGFELLSYHDI